MPTFRTAPLLLLVAGFATPASARDAGFETVVVHVARPADTSPAALRRLKGRIEEAALEACGADAGSLTEVRQAVHRSDCWRKSFAGGMAQANSPSGRDVAALSPPSATDHP